MKKWHVLFFISFQLFSFSALAQEEEIWLITNSDVYIDLYVSECDRACPSYNLKILGDGTVKFDGLWNTRKKGKHDFIIKRDKWLI